MKYNSDYTCLYHYCLLIASLYHSQISCSFAFDKASTTELHHTMALDCYDVSFHAPLAAVAVPLRSFWCVPSSSNIGRIPNGALPGLPPTKSTMAWLSGKSKGSPFDALPPAKKKLKHIITVITPFQIDCAASFLSQRRKAAVKNNLSFEHSRVIHLFFSSCFPCFLLASFPFISFHFPAYFEAPSITLYVVMHVTSFTCTSNDLH